MASPLLSWAALRRERCNARLSRRNAATIAFRAGTMFGAAMTHTHSAGVNRRRNLGFFFDDACARSPDKVAIIDLFGGHERSVTYRALDARMDGVAAMLGRLDIRPGERVGMLVGNRLEFVEFFFGAMRAGAIPVPLNTRLAADTLDYIFADAGRVAALVDPGCNPNAITIAQSVPLRHRLTLDDAHAGFLSFEAEMAQG